MGRRSKKPEKLRVIDFMFNDIEDPDVWIPDEPWNIDEWITVTVGDSAGGSNYQVHVCTPTSIKGQDKKRNLFMIDEYVGTEQLIRELDDFVQRVEKGTTGDPMHALARHWAWEYGSVDI